MGTTPVSFVEVLTSQEAADELEIHKATLCHWVERGRAVPLRTIPGQIFLFTREEVERLRRLPWPCEEPVCDFVGGSGQQLAAHRRRRHPAPASAAVA